MLEGSAHGAACIPCCSVPMGSDCIQIGLTCRAPGWTCPWTVSVQRLPGATVAVVCGLVALAVDAAGWDSGLVDISLYFWRVAGFATRWGADAPVDREYCCRYAAVWPGLPSCRWPLAESFQGPCFFQGARGRGRWPAPGRDAHGPAGCSRSESLARRGGLVSRLGRAGCRDRPNSASACWWPAAGGCASSPSPGCDYVTNM